MVNSTSGKYSPFVREESTTGEANSNFSIKAEQQGLSAGNAGYNFLADIAKQIHKNAVDKGFWEGEAANIPTKLMLIVSEISEAMEAHRKEIFTGSYGILDFSETLSDEGFVKQFEMSIKDTFEDELADATIRILDLAEHFKIDLGKHIKAKHRYNTTRNFMHGKKY